MEQEILVTVDRVLEELEQFVGYIPDSLLHWAVGT